MNAIQSFLLLQGLQGVLLLLQQLFQLPEEVSQVALLRSGHRDPADVILLVLLLDDFLQAGLLGLLLEVVEVEDVVPEFVVLLRVVRLEVQTLLLQRLPIDSADEAFLRAVFEHFLALASEGGEVVDEDAAHDVAEEHVHEDDVDHVVAEPAGLEDLHVVADLLLDVELDDAAEDALAVLLGVLLGVDGVHVVVDGEDGEEGDEGRAEEGQHPQHAHARLQRLQDVLQHLQPRHQQVDQQDAEPLDPVEHPHHAPEHEQHHVAELPVLLQAEDLLHAGHPEQQRHHRRLHHFPLLLRLLLEALVLLDGEVHVRLGPEEAVHECDHELDDGEGAEDGVLCAEVVLDDVLVGVVDDGGEVGHEEADEGGDLEAEVHVGVDLGVGDGEGQVEERVLVVQHVVVLDLLVDGLLGAEQSDDLVALRAAVDLLHDVVAGGAGEVAEDLVAREEEGLELVGGLVSGVHADLDAEQVALEQFDHFLHVVLLDVVADAPLELLHRCLLGQLHDHRRRLEHVHVVALVQLLPVQQGLQVVGAAYLLEALDEGQVLDVEGEDADEVAGEGVGGEVLVDVGHVALETADDVLDVGGVEAEDDEDVLLGDFELLLVEEVGDVDFEGGEVGEEGAAADEALVLQAGDLGDFVEEVDDGERHLDDVDVEVAEHAFELADAEGEEVDGLGLELVLLLLHDLLADVVLDLDVALAEVLEEDEGVLHVDYLLVELLLLLHRFGDVHELPHHDLLVVDVEVVGVGVVDARAVVLLGLAAHAVRHDRRPAVLDEVVEFAQQHVALVLADEFEDLVLVGGVLAEEEGDAEHEDGVAHLDGVAQVVDDERAEEGGHAAVVEEVLRLLDLGALLLLHQPLLDVLAEEGALALDEVGQQPDDQQLVLAADAHGVQLVHLHDGLDDLGVADHEDVVVAGARGGVELREHVVEALVDLLARELVEAVVDLQELHQLLPPLVDDDVLVLRTGEPLVLDAEPHGLRGGQVLGQRHLVLPALLLHLLRLRRVLGTLRLDLLDLLVDVAEEDDVEHVVAFALLLGLLALVGVGLDALLDLVEVLLALDLLVLEGVPVDEVAPEALAVVEEVALAEGDVVAADGVLGDVLDGGLLGLVGEPLHCAEGRVGHQDADALAHLRHVLVDVAAVDGLQQVLQHLDDLQQDERLLVVLRLLRQVQRDVVLVDLGLEEQVQRVQDLLQAEEHVAAQVAVPDGVADADLVVLGGVADQLHDAAQLAANDGQVLEGEGVEEGGVLAALVEVVEAVEVGAQVADDHPAAARQLQDLEEEVDGVHVGGLADVDHVLVLDEGAEDLEEGGDVAELRGDVEGTVLLGGGLVVLGVVGDPEFVGAGDGGGETGGDVLLGLEVDDLVVAADLVLGDEFHDHVLVDVVALVVEDDGDAEEVDEFALLVLGDGLVVGVLDDLLDEFLDLALLHQLLVVGVHLLVEVDAAHVLLQVALRDLQDVLQFALVLVVVPHQRRQEVVRRVQSAHRQRVARQFAHDLDEVDDQQVVVLALYQVLVQRQVLVLLRYDQVGPVDLLRRLGRAVQEDVVEGVEVVGGVEVGRVEGSGVGATLHHGHGEGGQFLDDAHLGLQLLLAGTDDDPEEVVGDVLVADGGTDEAEEDAAGGLDAADGEVLEVAARHEDDVLEGAEDFLALAGDSADEFEGEVGEFLVGVDEGLEEDEGVVDVLLEALAEDVAVGEDFGDLVLPELVDEEVALLLVEGGELLVLDVVLPAEDEVHLVVVVLAEVDVDLHHVLEVLGDDGDAHVVLVVDDDVEDARHQDLALHQQHDVGLVQLQLLLDASVHQFPVLRLAQVLVLVVLAVCLLGLLQHLVGVLDVEPHHLQQEGHHALHLVDVRPEPQVQRGLQDFQEGLHVDQAVAVVHVEVDGFRFHQLLLLAAFRLLRLLGLLPAAFEGQLVDAADVVEDEAHGLLDVGGDGVLGAGDLEVAELVPLLDLGDAVDLLVGGGLHEGVVDEADEGLEEEVLLDGVLVQEGDEGLEGQALLDVLERLLVALDADVGEQVEVLHEVGPVVLVGVVAALRLHQVALLEQLRQRPVLRLAAGNDAGQDLHLLLVLAELELVGGQLLLHAVLLARGLFGGVALLVEVLEDLDLVPGNGAVLAEAEAGEEVEVGGVGVVLVEVADEVADVVVVDLLEGEVVAVQELLDAAVDRAVGLLHDVVQVLVHVLRDLDLHQVVVRRHAFQQLVPQLVHRPHLPVLRVLVPLLQFAQLLLGGGAGEGGVRGLFGGEVGVVDLLEHAGDEFDHAELVEDALLLGVGVVWVGGGVLPLSAILAQSQSQMKPIRFFSTPITLFSRNTFSSFSSSSNVEQSSISFVNLLMISCDDSTNRHSCLISSATLQIRNPCSEESRVSPSFDLSNLLLQAPSIPFSFSSGSSSKLCPSSYSSSCSLIMSSMGLPPASLTTTPKKYLGYLTFAPVLSLVLCENCTSAPSSSLLSMLSRRIGFLCGPRHSSSSTRRRSSLTNNSLPEARWRRIYFSFLGLFFSPSSSASVEPPAQPALTCPSCMGLPTVCVRKVWLRLLVEGMRLPRLPNNFLLGSLMTSAFRDGGLDLPRVSSVLSSTIFISSISQRPSKMSVRSASPSLRFRQT